MAPTFLMRWCSSSRISLCSLSAASRSLAYAGRGQQTLRIDLGLREQKPQADIFCRQFVLVWGCAACGARFRPEIAFRHH